MQVSKLHANCATETTSEIYLPQVSVTTALQKGAMGRKPRVKNESSFVQTYLQYNMDFT